MVDRVDNGMDASALIVAPPPQSDVSNALTVAIPSHPHPLTATPSFPEPKAQVELTPYSTPANLSPHAKQYINADQYITIMEMDAPLGKEFSVDPINNKLVKRAVPNNGQGYCKTVYVPNNEAFKHYIEQTALSHNAGIILGYVKGTEPEAGSWEGETYRLVTNNTLMELSGSTKKRSRTWRNKEGLHVAARTATMFERSTWVCFDLDTNEFTPLDLKQKIAEIGYHKCLVDLIPQLEGIEYCAVPSSSSRITLNGERPYKVNHHIYMQTISTADQRRFAMAALLKSQDTLYGYDIPARNAKTFELEPWRRSTHASILDVSVFSKARIMFEGKPILSPTCQAVQSGALQVNPVTVITSVASENPFLAIDTSAYLDPVFNTQKKLGFEFINGINGFRAINTVDLTPDVLIEWKSDETGETGFMTMKEFVEGDDMRLRAQNPFKTSSQSWSAFLSKENLDGESISPRLISNEYGTYIYNDNKEAFSDAPIPDLPQEERAEAPSRQVEAETSFDPSRPPTTVSDPSRPPSRPPTIPVKPSQSPRADVVERSRALGSYGGTVHQIPDQISDPLLGQFFIDRYFDGRPIVSVAGARVSTLYEWNGFHYESVNKELVKHYLVEGAKLGQLKSFTTTKLGSVVGMLSALSYTKPPSPLPKHITPFANGLFDFNTGVLSPHDPQYFYTKVNDVYYDASIVPTVFNEILQNSSGGCVDWQQRFKDLLSYLLVGGDNTDHKIVWFDGLPRSGKSTVVKALIKLVHSYMPIELSKLIDPKVLINCADKALVFDDDTQTPQYKDREEITGLLKKMSTGGLFEITQLYTQELFQTELSTKLLFICNGIPTLYDPSGALVARSEVLNFDVTYADDADLSIEGRLNDPDQLSGLFNVLWENYLDLLKRSGYPSLEDYQNNPSKPLQFHQDANSKEAKKLMQSENEPLFEFVDDCVVFTNEPSDVVTHDEMVVKVREYVRQNDHLNSLSKWGTAKITRTLRGMMIRNKAKPIRTWKVRGYSGVRLKHQPINWDK